MFVKLNKRTILQILKIFLGIFIFFYPFWLSLLLANFEIGSILIDANENGITSILQWICIVVFRFFIYLVPGLLFALIKHDKRNKKYLSRFILWEDFVLKIYLLERVFYHFLAINLIANAQILGSLDDFIIIVGFILTRIKKEKIELGNPIEERGKA